MSSILDQDIKFLPNVGPKTKEILSKELGINSYGDLLEYFPYKYVDRSKIFHISELTPDMPYVQIKGKILSYEERDTGKRNSMLVAHFSDGYGVADLIWFRGTQYILKNFKVGTEYIVFGKPSVYGGRFQFTHPDIDDASKLQITEMGMQPFYGMTEIMKKRGYSSRSIEKITKSLVRILPPLPETLPDFLINRLHLVSRDAALRMIHYPHSHQEMQKAQVRLKFEELFYVQLNILRYASDQRRKYRGYVFNRIGDIFNGFYNHNLPFELTGAQKRVMHEIRADMCSGKQMNRLLQGDVGSGKTLVALMTMLIALDNGYQACLMAPTEILAEQHLQTIREFLKGMDIRVELLTGIVKGKKRKEILDGLATGAVQILIGTHAVLEDPVSFCRLGIAVIDEQHRFGVEQRARLWAKSANPPHVLVMTATPIPRTLAMTIYGDLDGFHDDKYGIIVENAIRNHSAFRIDERLDEYTVMFCNILRDADKVDIFRVNVDTPAEDIYNVTTEELKNSQVSPEVMAAFDERHAVLRSCKKTVVDHVAGHIALTFELVYPISLQIANERGYLDKMMAFESDNEVTGKQFEEIRAKLNEYVASVKPL